MNIILTIAVSFFISMLVALIPYIISATAGYDSLIYLFLYAAVIDMIILWKAGLFREIRHK